MKAFIFCGGKATRFNNGKPGPLKTLIKINRIPIIIRILQNLKRNSINQIFLLGGYKCKELFFFFKKKNKFNVKIINTGINTSTAGRLLKVKEFINENENFLLTYGDSLVNFKKENALKLKKKNNFVISSYKFKFMYGILKLSSHQTLLDMQEKENIFINSGFYILDKKIYNFIKSKKESFEKHVIPRILKSKKIKFKINYINSWLPIDNDEDKQRASIYFKKNEKK
jgi:glucose-1-phosphate cytidylyltransferase